MPKTPKGAKRPADVIGNAVLVMKIATGEAEEPPDKRDPAAVALSRRGAAKGGQVRARKLSASRRLEISKKATKARWGG